MEPVSVPFTLLTDASMARVEINDAPNFTETKTVRVTVPRQLMISEDLREVARYFLQLANEMDGRKRPTLGPQHEQILNHIAAKGSISNVEAQAVYRIRSLPRRIKDLKELGYSFKTEMRKDPTGQRYARYSFA